MLCFLFGYFCVRGTALKICSSYFTVLATAPEATDDAVVIIRTTVLVFLLVLSLIGNALVVLSVAQARSSCSIPFNSFVLSMA